MNNLTLSYPPMPAGADKSIIKPSKAFKKHVYLSIGAILLFIVCYLLLFLSAIGIAVAFGYLGVFVMQLHATFLTLAFGFALIISGLLLIYFVIKFIFKRTRIDQSDLIEIKQADEPALFDFIHKVTAEAGAPKPKRIYLSADVNAAVFYNSSFWSMFLPVKKNLKIGLGLVNAINLSEFKTVMAHEFGHFSQKSMKVGSYIYNFNRVVYDMLYDTEDYGKILNSFSKMHSVFSLVAVVNVRIVQGIQYILKKLYVVINKANLALSREMEFHADSVAAYVSGSNHIATSLKRVDIAQVCYDNLINYSRANLAENKRTANLYPQHLEFIKQFCRHQKMDLDETDLPVIKDGWNPAYNSEIIIKDQWSSHPTTEDREARANQLNLPTTPVTTSAWVLFKDPTAVQAQITNHLYAIVNTDPKADVIDFETFKEDFYKQISTSSYNPVFNNYFDNRNITEFNIDDTIKTIDTPVFASFDTLLTIENSNLPKVVNRIQQDIDLLARINQNTSIKTFDFRGDKYSVDSIYDVEAILKHDLAQTQKRIEDLDKHIFLFFYNKADADHKPILTDKYRYLFNFQKEFAVDYDFYNDIIKAISPVYSQMKPEQIVETLSEVYKQEREVKKRVKEIIDTPVSRTYYTDAQIIILEEYLASQYVYYNNPGYDNTAINKFHEALGAYITGISDHNFEIKKDLLNFQAELL
ncbi:Zn-dependent protease with chaperone function [Mucilaginibacter oryzae]|uniref:Zn-dependent protease with chaperone function n=1 Tax=Mucilaginibacter oryzae TaxID=468058 RepID=A0A316HEZ3_9SPHI|nr:M48 family metallopeptidase [Mucilaginibacter oryzae]PWK79789.1 Zn-dependent protease with chaperone function [Mucilaginibacter oryzae]